MSRKRRRSTWIASLLLALLLGTACGSQSRSWGDVAQAPGPTRKAASQGDEENRDPAEQRPLRDGSRKPGVAPVRLVIDIGLSAPVIRLGLNPDETLEVPQDYSLTGWWTGGARPGERGPAVIVGHIDSESGPAVFFRLHELEPGQTVQVTSRSGRMVEFEVRRLEQHPKDAFPTNEVYGNTRNPSLRLITCGGEFDRSSGHYVDNIIVFASLAKR